MKRLLVILATAAVMAGCGSAVKLDEVEVVDRTGTTLQQDGAQGVGSGVADAGLVAVDIGKTSDQTAPPVGPRIVYFDHDSFVVKPEFQGLLDKNASYIKLSPSRSVVIAGHTDDTGGREYNLALGQKRAEAVRSALGLLGVSDAKLEAVSFGKEKPVSPGTDEASRAKNRRAEISYRQ